eukprot:1892709-Alexandrium_andersonii.AAC.1
MSASLVGSEMCIRDSNSSEPMRRLQARKTARKSCASRPARRHPRHRLQTVSYTHLTLPTICSV